MTPELYPRSHHKIQGWRDHDELPVNIKDSSSDTEGQDKILGQQGAIGNTLCPNCEGSKHLPKPLCEFSLTIESPSAVIDTMVE